MILSRKYRQVNKFKQKKCLSGREVFEKFGYKDPKPSQKVGDASFPANALDSLRSGEKTAKVVFDEIQAEIRAKESEATETSQSSDTSSDAQETDKSDAPNA